MLDNQQALSYNVKEQTIDKEILMNPKITLVGRVGTTPEKMGTSGIRFRVVTADRVKNENGEWEEKNTSWWTVKAWKGLAQQSQNLAKGQEIVVLGTIAQDDWTDSSGNTRSSYDITADSIAITTFSLTKDTPAKEYKVKVSSDESAWAQPVDI